MPWTKEPPTTAGHYWWCKKGQVAVVVDFDGHFVDHFSLECARLPQDMGGEWLGPISPGDVDNAYERAAKIAEGDTSRDDFPWCGDVRDIAAAIREEAKRVR